MLSLLGTVAVLMEGGIKNNAKPQKAERTSLGSKIRIAS